MPTSSEFKDFVLECLESCGTHYHFKAKKMFGEYCIYVWDSCEISSPKPIFLLCDETLFIKQHKELATILESAPKAPFYKGTKQEWHILDIDSIIKESNPYILRITPALSLYANSEFVTLYFEPSLGYKIIYEGKKSSKLIHTLTWGAYSEVKLHPIKDLEWYFEMGVNSSGSISIPVNFRSATGINWYFI